MMYMNRNKPSVLQDCYGNVYSSLKGWGGKDALWEENFLNFSATSLLRGSRASVFHL